MYLEFVVYTYGPAGSSNGYDVGEGLEAEIVLGARHAERAPSMRKHVMRLISAAARAPHAVQRQRFRQRNSPYELGMQRDSPGLIRHAPRRCTPRG